MLGLCWHASSQILYTDRNNTENSCPVLTLNVKIECFHAVRFCRLAWCRQGRITSSTSPITPFEQFGTFKAHREVLLLSLWPPFSGSTFTAPPLSSPRPLPRFALRSGNETVGAHARCNHCGILIERSCCTYRFRNGITVYTFVEQESGRLPSMAERRRIL